MRTVRTAGWSDSVSVLDRITTVFEAFGDSEEGLGVTELARRANLPKSTVSRIAADLVDQRLLDRAGGRLHLGVRLFELGHAVEMPRRLRALAQPVLTELRNTTGHTVQLAVLDAADVVVLATMRGRHGYEGAPPVGAGVPAHASALGKTMLATSPEATVEHALARQLTRCTVHTICDPGELRRELARVRRDGLAHEREEAAAGRTALAAPVLSLGSVPVAAVGVIGAVGDLSHDRAAAAVRRAAMSLGRRVDAHHEHR